MPTVFLSYRSRDTRTEAGRLVQDLKRELGEKYVFRDVDDIPPGAEFDIVLKDELSRAKVVLVLIGPEWLREIEGRSKGSEVDYHRLEVATALEAKRRVIPILVRGAVLPPSAALPDDLIALAKRQAMAMRDESWRKDLDRLVTAIGRPYRFDLLGLRAAGALIIVVLADWLVVPQLVPDRAADYVFLRWVATWLFTVYGSVELIAGCMHYRRNRQDATASR